MLQCNFHSVDIARTINLIIIGHDRAYNKTRLDTMAGHHFVRDQIYPHRSHPCLHAREA